MSVVISLMKPHSRLHTKLWHVTKAIGTPQLISNVNRAGWVWWKRARRQTWNVVTRGTSPGAGDWPKHIDSQTTHQTSPSDTLSVEGLGRQYFFCSLHAHTPYTIFSFINAFFLYLWARQEKDKEHWQKDGAVHGKPLQLHMVVILVF